MTRALRFFRAAALAAACGTAAAEQAPMASEQAKMPPEVAAVVDTSSPMGDSLTLLPHGVGKPAVGLKDFGAFAYLAVLHEGRVKPMESLARDLLLQWSGHSSYAGRSALSVLANILFAPGQTGDYKIFRIDNPEVAEALHVKPDEHRRYAYRTLEPALHHLQAMAMRADSVPAEKRSVVQKEVLLTFSNIIAYLNLTRTLQFARPASVFAVHDPQTRQRLNLPDDDTPPSFWDLMDRAPLLAHILESVGQHPDSAANPVDADIVRLSRYMYLESQLGQSSLLTILPQEETDPNWLSPAEVIGDPARLQKYHSEINLLAGMTKDYRRGDAQDFSAQSRALRADVARLAPLRLSKTNFGLEVRYDRVNPLFLAIIAYGIALLLCFLFFLFRKPLWYRASVTAALAGFALHLGGIVSRILIMRRPPVTSLYETFPFVALISIIAALFIERRTRQGIGLLAATLLGFILLLIANRYAADGDTMQMLVAVLNSNFWLSTHVVCITTGYGACLLCGAIGHIYLVRRAVQGKSPGLREIDRMVYGTLCFGMLFSFIGTVLGGIWADQSWGRFWGWDPKENGALLIVLWCAILLHARYFGIIRELGMAVGSVLGAIIVSLAWLGVNLLGVGLHSYGFTSGAAVKLFSYIGAELLFLIVVGIFIALKPHGVTHSDSGHGVPTTARP